MVLMMVVGMMTKAYVMTRYICVIVSEASMALVLPSCLWTCLLHLLWLANDQETQSK